MTAKVYVTLKKAVLNPQGKAVERSLAQLGFPAARNVRVGRFIEIRSRGGIGTGSAQDRRRHVQEAVGGSPSLKTTASRNRGVGRRSDARCHPAVPRFEL